MTPQIPMLTEYGELRKAYEQAEKELKNSKPNYINLKSLYEQLAKPTNALKILQKEKGENLENLLEQIKQKCACFFYL